MDIYDTKHKYNFGYFFPQTYTRFIRFAILQIHKSVLHLGVPFKTKTMSIISFLFNGTLLRYR